MYFRVVLKPHFLDGAFQERRLLLPQEDQAQVLPPSQRVPPSTFSAYNSFQKALPMVNHDRKHYTPCFILEEEQVFFSPFRTITTKTTVNYSARIATSWNHPAAAPSYASFSSFDKMISLLIQSYSDGSQTRPKEELLLRLPRRLRGLPARKTLHMQHIDDINHRRELRANKFSKFIL